MRHFDKKVWIGRKYRCIETGVVVELTEQMVAPRAFIPVGNGAIDLGDGFYSRTIGKVERVNDDH